MVEAETGIEANIPTLIWNKYKQSGWYQSSSLYDTFLQSILQHVQEHPIKETKFIANYAATNIVPSHLGEAKIIHGAKMYENWNKTKQVRVNPHLLRFRDIPHFYAILFSHTTLFFIHRYSSRNSLWSCPTGTMETLLSYSPIWIKAIIHFQTS